MNVIFTSLIGKRHSSKHAIIIQFDYRYKLQEYNVMHSDIKYEQNEFSVKAACCSKLCSAIVLCCFSERNNEYYFQSWGLWLISHEAQGSLLWTDLTQIEDQKLTSTTHLLEE